MTTTIPRLQKVSDNGDHRHYHHRCDTCGMVWEGAWYSPAAYDETCSEPYTLRQNGEPCDRFSYHSAAEMHHDFRLAVKEHDCQPLAVITPYSYADGDLITAALRQHCYTNRAHR